jgi:Two component regulator propeller
MIRVTKRLGVVDAIVPSLLALSTIAVAADFKPAPQEFQQEVPLHWKLPTSDSPNGFFLADLTPDGAVRVTDGHQWFALHNNQLEAVPSPGNIPAGAAWIQVGATARVLPVPFSTIHQIQRQGDVVWLATEKGAVRLTPADAGTELAGKDVRQIATGPDNLVLAATAQGLWRREQANQWEPVRVVDPVSRDWTEGDVRGVAIDAEGNWWVATPAGVIRRQGDHWSFFTGREGLPYADFTCVAVGANSEIWFGTHRGAVRFDGKNWAYREGQLWLPGNDVRSIAVSGDGRVWFATDKGLGCDERRTMTLAQKAAFYEREIERYIKRTPYGYTSEVGLGAPGDRSKIIYSDSDNDGLWTSMYGAGECFAYGATKDPAAKKRAKEAFEALRFLQKVTQGCKHSPPKGFVARSIRPIDWPDPNVGRVASDKEDQKGDQLWKVIDPRWPKSADGKWYWKCDTSSDELDGHFFFYPAYYDLVADTEAERERVREVVRDLADDLLTHDFALVDHDGKPTRWAVYGPEQLNNDPRWWLEHGLNSLSILSYLTVAEHITGDPKYGRAIQELIEKHGYAANVMTAKMQMGVGSGNQSDDEMMIMSFYNLVRYTQVKKYRPEWLFAFFYYWRLEQPEMNPFFNFAYAGVARGQTFADAFGPISLDPWAGWFADSMATLRGFPLDRANWGHHNSQRLDLVPLRRQEMQDFTADQRPNRAGRVNGKVLPVENRFFNHWNTDPWELDYGGDGRELASGTVYLLPYYMGLYFGFIEKPH